jgi:N-acetylneuraminate synthase
MGVHVIAEAGINHNASLEMALHLIDAGKEAGVDSVKFQKRVPELSVPEDWWDVPKVPPWGGPSISYLEYKRQMELSEEEYSILLQHGRALGVEVWASAWDIPSAEFLLSTEPRHIKIPSAKQTDLALLRWISANAGHTRPVLSTGMGNEEEMIRAVGILHENNPVVMHCVSAYPCPVDELNLAAIPRMKGLWPELTIGYSGHETGLATTVAAVALGAEWIERHLTLDRSLPGTDHAASVEPEGFKKLVHDIRNVEQAMGGGVKAIMPAEEAVIPKLRGRVQS